MGKYFPFFLSHDFWVKHFASVHVMVFKSTDSGLSHAKPTFSPDTFTLPFALEVPLHVFNSYFVDTSLLTVEDVTNFLSWALYSRLGILVPPSGFICSRSRQILSCSVNFSSRSRSKNRNTNCSNDTGFPVSLSTNVNLNLLVVYLLEEDTLVATLMRPTFLLRPLFAVLKLR